MQRNVLVGLGLFAAVLSVAVVFWIGRVTASPGAASATTSLAATTSGAESTASTAAETTTVALTTGDAVADAGDDFVVSMASTVTLDGSRSNDPEGGVLEYTWTQISGPDVTDGTGSLAGGTAEFVAPDAVVSLVFELTVDDGEVSGGDTILVQVVEEAGSAVFVDMDATGRGLGNGTMASPATSLLAGLGIGAEGTGVDLYLKMPTSGEYLVPENGLELPPNTSIYGGYDDSWIRDVENPTLITGGSTVFALAPEGGHTVLSGLEIVGLDDTDGDAVAVFVGSVDVPGGDVVLEDVIVTAGDAGGNGAQSIAVVAGGTFDLAIVRSSLTAGAASAGHDGDDGVPPNLSPAPIPGEDASGRDGGGGRNIGGDGGSALAGIGENGNIWLDLGGAGGKAGRDGGDGETAGVGGGTGGAGGSNEPFGGESSGQPGERGRFGRGGGGGGGGGGKIGLEGGGGGGGGEGGRWGSAGAGGFGGGESVGLLLVQLEGRVAIDATVIVAGRGGDGGDGGVGSPGTPGAKGGTGAKGSCSFLGCGAGQAGAGGDGAGGAAGSEGGQGGGGAGGASIAIAMFGAKTELTIIDSTLQGGTGGTGGTGGLGGLSAVGANGRTPSSGLVPDTNAPAVSAGAGGGHSIGFFLQSSGDTAPKIEVSELLGGVGGAAGAGPIPGLVGTSAPTNF